MAEGVAGGITMGAVLRHDGTPSGLEGISDLRAGSSKILKLVPAAFTRP